MKNMENSKEFLPSDFEHQKDESNSNQLLTPIYKKGDFIGEDYEVYGTLGKGGFGLVYLVYAHNLKSAVALKTFRDEFLADARTREQFKKEASVWVDLEFHPYIVGAHLVDEINGRLYIGLEYIPPDKDGLNTLEGYLRKRPPDLLQSLRWAIQFCYGMEYIYSKGIRCHRDIKPANIMIDNDNVVRITDFGLSGILDISKRMGGIRLNITDGRIGLSMPTIEGGGCGTLTHMPPEQFTNAASCDERSDIYSFGIVLYQMVTGGELPFLAPFPKDGSDDEMMRFGKAMHLLHKEAPIPKLNSPLFPIIKDCLEKNPDKRYQTFKELRSNLEPILKSLTGEIIRPPEKYKINLCNKGICLTILGRFKEAIDALKQAIRIEPDLAGAYCNLGNAYNKLGRYDDAIEASKQAIRIKPDNAFAYCSLGNTYKELGRYDDAIESYKQAIRIEPDDAVAYCNLGIAYDNLGRYDDAIEASKQAIRIKPDDAVAYCNLGIAYDNLGRYDDVIESYKQAIRIKPDYAEAYYNLGNSYGKSGRYDDAIESYKQAIRIKPDYAEAYYNLGIAYDELGRYDDAIKSYKQAIRIKPDDADAYYNLGIAYDDLGMYQDAIESYKQAIRIKPDDASAYNNLGIAYKMLGRFEEAIEASKQAIRTKPDHANAYYNLGITYLLTGNRSLALEQYEILRKLDAEKSKELYDLINQR